MKVIAYQNESLDDICWRVLGNTDIIEQVCELNPHALTTPHIAAGTVIELPDIVVDKTNKPTIKLWG